MKVAFAFIFLSLGIFGFSQNDSIQKIPFVAYWSNGDSYDYLITKVNKEWKGDLMQKNDSTSYYAVFTVIDSTATSYKINWKYKSNFANLPSHFGELLNNNSVVMDFIYTTNELGEFIGVENWEEVAELMTNTINSTINNELSKNPKLVQNDIKNALKPILNIFSSKEGIEMIVLKELQYFHFPMGVEFDPREPLFYDEEFPNLLNGDHSLRGDAKITFQTVDHENSFCIFNQEIKVNSDDAKNMILEFFNQMNFKNFEEEFKDGKLDITDNNYYEYFYYPGVPYYIETERLSEFNIGDTKNKKIELTRIELILEED